ncbi:MAG TPA: HesA/MoeB/ThiF family protein, partial [Candidatus Wunengus sp. YC61]|uniref:HesA/MoeB/ThiF family protein n=1 Tax=Candidatus Wunengus sp. YC61 TaxID=3367698 RepID=UPI00402719E1
EKCFVGIIGLGGGGSHIVQQLAHIGFLNYVIIDPDTVDLSNLNRLVCCTLKDAQNKEPKINVAKRTILELHPTAIVKAYQGRWQEQPLLLRDCDVLFGCVDGFSERRELEAGARRFLIPYIDIGLDVNHVPPEPPVMAGQVILSMPGEPCLSCVGFLTEDKLAKEAEKYGDAGINPQVIWVNGVLASTAVGIAVDLITDWTTRQRQVVYLSYEGNKNILEPHMRLKYRDIKESCRHYPADQVGEPYFLVL